jgi:hypothetical protein
VVTRGIQTGSVEKTFDPKEMGIDLGTGVLFAAAAARVPAKPGAAAVSAGEKALAADAAVGVKTAEKGFIDPKNVRFCQDSCSSSFRAGGSINELADGLKSGRIKPGDVPAIRVFERDGKLFTLDNRRLEAFRRAGVEIPYRQATPEEIANEAWKFTTQNAGESIRVRGEE